MDHQKNQHGNNVFVFTEAITPIDGRADDVLELSIKSTELMQGQPGMIQYMVTRSEKSDGKICSTVVWAQKSDFQNFMKSDAMATLLKSEGMVNIKAWMSDYKSTMSNYVDGWHT